MCDGQVSPNKYNSTSYNNACQFSKSNFHGIVEYNNIMKCYYMITHLFYRRRVRLLRRDFRRRPP